MKFLVSVILALAPFASAGFTGHNCGEGRVPSSLNGICIEVSSYIEGCQQYKTENSCQKCSDSYYLSDGRCQFTGINQQPNNIVGCLQWQETSFNGQTKKKCTNCANGFIRAGGSCEKGVANCQRYDQLTKQCQQCKNDYSLIMGLCRHNYLLGCRSQNSDHTCKECFKPFVKDEAHCTIPDCKSFNDFGCVACQCGFYLTQGRVCKEVREGCLRYNRGMCINCLPHYKLKGGICEIQGCESYTGNICQKCKSQRYDKDTKTGGCVYRNCYDWHNDNCLVCKQGFKRNSDGICQQVGEQRCAGSLQQQSIGIL